ncbi:MAG: LysR family transcriptional regulator [Acidihalobacter sp.]|uniref:LysR family transcriptional regulator n=1 Tax=Acidihalobacter sp. TaxID=1872108 RepID=UPI00307E03BE
MDIHQLRTIVAIARSGSIARAADRLFLSQPTLSGHVKTLEESFGFSLFERQARGMVPTEAGRRILIHAEHLLAIRDDLLSEATRIGKEMQGDIVLGIPPNLRSLRLERLLEAQARDYPGIALTFRTLPSPQILEDIVKGHLDGGYAITACSSNMPDLTLLELRNFRVRAAAPAAWAARIHGVEPITDLPWVLPVPGTICHHVAGEILDRHRIRPSHVVCVANENITRELIEKGVGIGFVHENDPAPSSPVQDDFFRLEDYVGDACLGFAYASGRPTAPLLSAIAAIIRTTWETQEE